MRLALVLPLLVVASVAQAQPVPGTCEHGTAHADLRGSEVLARLFNNGNLFYSPDEGGGHYKVPANVQCVEDYACTAVYAVNLWLGGSVEGEVRTAAALFDRYEFWPGPLGADAAPPTDCAFFDRIWTVSRDDVARYYETGEAAPDLRDWPANLGAPVLDGDGIAGNYDLAAGDQPAISGDQMAWWVMNDVGNVHAYSGSAPLGVEVQVSAFAVMTPSVLGQTTYYRYRIVNRNAVPIDSLYATVWSQEGLGGSYRNAFASDTTRDMGYTYSLNETDGYYGVPPAFGRVVVQGPEGLPNGRDDDDDGAVDEAGERLGMTAFVGFINGAAPPIRDPQERLEFYHVMQGRWTDGTPMTEGGIGYRDGGPETRFTFPGDPVTEAFWSAEDMDGNGQQFFGSRNIRETLSTGPFRLAPGATEELVYAFVFAQGADRLDSVVELRRAAIAATNAYEAGYFDPVAVERGDPVPPSDELLLSAAYPNPFTATVSVRFSVPEAMPARLAVYDALGREVAVLVDEVTEPGEQRAMFDGSALPTGTYFVVFEAAGERRTLPVVKRD